MSGSRVAPKPKQNYQVINETEQASSSLVKLNLNSIEVEALLAEEARLVHAMQTKESTPEHNYNSVENLSTVLVQALHTKDQELIYYALENDDEQLVANTVRGIQASKAAQLLESIQEAILNRPYNTYLYSKWLKHLLRTHITTLISKSHLPLVNNIKTVLSTRTKNLQDLIKLKGKLSVMVEQLATGEHARKQPKRTIRQVDEEMLQADQEQLQMDQQEQLGDQDL